ncbi:hypothetical protein SUDANB176_06627 [Streptomyces sp. enrichment culture]
MVVDGGAVGPGERGPEPVLPVGGDDVRTGAGACAVLGAHSTTVDGTAFRLGAGCSRISRLGALVRLAASAACERTRVSRRAPQGFVRERNAVGVMPVRRRKKALKTVG